MNDESPVTDDVKAKFREALAKKQAHGGTDVSDHSEHGKVDGVRGAKTSGTQQMFRRKSG
ncbi:hypothetical protein GCM10009584_22460 [Ornithinimicrobium humiphilum]|uniref:DUF5302 domain-containing protein n=1 Tax=Ornithinimicrobium humiphilum TaxID=125288 RepID=A0A543KN13_9MICO|nr:DUF5302 domain-containing protein [Ornithinimicrobium humiphilum]TQM96460.1 hypothetical protein FB476_1328 [Ornithinimicrobium humiphilum]